MADLTFVSRRDSSFKEFPPASAQIAKIPLPLARYIAASHANRTPYSNLPDAFAVTTVSEAYRAQEALARLLAHTGERRPVRALLLRREENCGMRRAQPRVPAMSTAASSVKPSE